MALYTIDIDAQALRDYADAKDAAHLAAIDPHGDRAYANTQIAAEATARDAAIAAAVTSIWRDRGTLDASPGLYPTTGGSGPGGGVKRGDVWTVEVAGNLNTVPVDVGDIVRALTDSPGQANNKWTCSEHNIEQATESLRGTAKIATEAQAASSSTTDDAAIITPKKWWKAWAAAFVDGCVTTAKIANGAVGTAQLGYGVVTADKLAIDSVIGGAILNKAVTLAKVQDIAANSILGNNTGSAAITKELTAAQVAAMLPVMVGDAGSGGTKGLVPAPAAGDGSAKKFLCADGTWAAVPAPSPLTTINAQTGTSYTLALTDGGPDKMLTQSNAAAITTTVPNNSSVAFPIGTVISGTQTGAGRVTISPASGVTITSRDSCYRTMGTGSPWTLLKTATNTWLLWGDLIL